MGTDVAKAGGGLLSIAAALDNMQDRVNEQVAETGTTLGAYMQFSGKTGEYKFNGTPLEYGTVLAFNLLMMQKGVICWKDEKPIKRQLVYSIMSNDPVPEVPEDPNPGEDWRMLIEVPVKSLSDGTEAQFGLSTASGTRALTRLLSEWHQRARMNLEADGKTPKVCLVEINATKFKTPPDADGKTSWAHAPQFKIVEWVAASDLIAELSGGVETTAEVEAVAAAPAVTAPPPPPAPVAAVKAPAAAAAPAGRFGSGLRGARK